MDQPTQPEGPRHEEQRSRLPSVNKVVDAVVPVVQEAGRLAWEHPEALAVGAAVVYGVAHVMEPEEIPESGESAPAPEAEDLEAEPKLNEWVKRKVELFEIMYGEDPELIYFYTPQGEILKRVKVPKNWAKRSEAEQQKQLKKEKRELNHEGPVFIDGLVVSFPGLEGKSLVETATERSKEKFHDPRYFEGEEKSIRDAMWELADAYEVPVEVVIGFAANQSMMDGNGIDRTEDGDVGGRGLFKFTTGAYNDALGYMSHNTDFVKRVRTEKLGEFKDEWKNPFVQTEAFCAYYRKLRLQLNKEGGAVSKLTSRLRKLDPNFPKDILEESSVISAYHSGPTRITKIIEAFVELEDKEIRKRLGPPPYWIDVWPQIMSQSFGKDIEEPQNQKAFDFSAKVYAVASLMSNSGEDYVDDATEEHSKFGYNLLKLLKGAAALGAIAGGLVGVGKAGVKKKVHGEDLSRRDLLKLAVSAAALATVPGTAGIEALADSMEGNEGTPPLIEESVEPKNEVLVFDEALPAAKKTLDEVYEALRKDKRIYRTSNEKNDSIRYKQPKQDVLLKETFGTILGEDLRRKIIESKGRPQKERNKLYDQAHKKFIEYRDARIADGTFIALEEDNPLYAYFCQQVGMGPGMITNNANCLYVHKDLIPLLGSVVALTNHQIDLFNKNPTAYGMGAKFPELAHISAVKLSGALREPNHTKRMLNGPEAGKTTRSPSAHWSGQALDIASLATAGAHVVRFKEDMKDEEGSVKVSAGEKLSTGGFGITTRKIVSTMIGRALFALRDPLIKEGLLEIMPLWEGGQEFVGGQLNWHVAAKPLKNK